MTEFSFLGELNQFIQLLNVWGWFDFFFHVFNYTFNQLNASLLNKCINYKKNLTAPKLFEW